MQRFQIFLGFVATVWFFKEVRSKTREKTCSRAHRLLAKSAYLEIFRQWNYQDVKMLQIETRKPSTASPAVQSTLGIPHSDPKYTLDMWMVLFKQGTLEVKLYSGGQFIWMRYTCCRCSILSLFTSCEEALKKLSSCNGGTEKSEPLRAY